MPGEPPARTRVPQGAGLGMFLVTTLYEFAVALHISYSDESEFMDIGEHCRVWCVQDIIRSRRLYAARVSPRAHPSHGGPRRGGCMMILAKGTSFTHV